MPILVDCPCGKQLRVPEEYAGKRVKCRACGMSLPVPASTGNAAKDMGAVEPAEAAEPETIRFACPCGQRTAVPKEFAGRLVRCPACGETMMVPGERVSKRTHSGPQKNVEPASKPSPAAVMPKPISQPKTKSRPQMDEEPLDVTAADEDEGLEEIIPRRQRGKSNREVKKKSKLGLWIAFSTCTVLLFAGGAAALSYWLANRGSTPVDEFAFVADDAEGYAYIRVAEIWSHPFLKKTLQPFPAQQATVNRQLTSDLGLAPEDIESIQYVWSKMNPAEFWGVFKCTKPFDYLKILNSTGLPVDEAVHEGRKYHVNDAGNKAIHFNGDKIFVYTQSDTAMKSALHAVSGRVSPASLAGSALARVREGHHFLAVFAPPANMVEQNKNSLPPAMKPLEPLMALNRFSLVADLTDKLNVNVDAQYADGAKAQTASEAAKKGLDMAKAFMAVSTLGTAKDPKAVQGGMTKLGEVLNQIKPEVNGSVLSARLTLDDSIFASAQPATPNVQPGKTANIPPLSNAKGRNMRIPPAAAKTIQQMKEKMTPANKGS